MHLYLALQSNQESPGRFESDAQHSPICLDKGAQFRRVADAIIGVMHQEKNSLRRFLFHDGRLRAQGQNAVLIDMLMKGNTYPDSYGWTALLAVEMVNVPSNPPSFGMDW